MLNNFKINIREIDKIKKISKEEKKFRVKNLSLFNEVGFPNKKNEDWKFSDLKTIISKNFDKFIPTKKKTTNKKFNFIKDFEHNYIILVNGEFNSSNFKYEEKENLKIKTFEEKNFFDEKSNSLINLNNALFKKGYSLEVKENYKFKKILIFYNLFTENLKANILNSKNKIILKKNSELHTIDYVINLSKNKFFNNVYESIILEEKAVYKNICIQNEKSNGFFHKFCKSNLASDSNYSSFIFPSGLKFNKLDLEFNLKGPRSECNLQSAFFSNSDDHQEIKTKVNHIAPNCKSYQKVKSVLNSEGKGVYQGKILVKENAQKTDAYQLSKAMLLSDNSEFNSKPELEIYADDVKCSHGSSSGSVDEDSIYYLMSRGLSRKEAVKLIVNGFLNEIIESIESNSIRRFVQKKIEGQIHEY